MRCAPQEQNRAAARKILIIATIWLGIFIALILFPSGFTSAAVNTSIQTTISDFNTGFFYHTGLTQSTLGGGDGDGEVRLLTMGISPSTWNPGGTGANATGLPALYAHAAVQKNGRLYVSGGQLLLGYSSGVYYTTINPTTHNLANWTATTALPEQRIAHGMAAVGNYLYVIGGVVAVGATDVTTNTVLVAPILAGGALGSWTKTAPLPMPLQDFATVVVSDTIYVLGGYYNHTTQNVVYYAKPDAGGAITSWVTNTASLPLPTTWHTAASYNGAIYIMGGTNLAGTWYYDVYHGFPDSSGAIAAWQTGTDVALQNNVVFGSAVAYAGEMYIAGGETNNGSTLTNTIASNLMNVDGRITSSWVDSNVLSTERWQTAAVVSDDGWIYVIEGASGAQGTDPLNTIDYGPTAAAGATEYAPSGTYLSAILDLGDSRNVTGIDWRTTVSSGVTLTLQYRLGGASDLKGVAWSSPFTAPLGTLITNTIPISASARYVQYYATYTRNVSGVSPVLSAVEIKYPPPPTPTPTATSVPWSSPTPTPTGFWPDFTVSAVQTPVPAGTAMTQTVQITVTNLGNLGFNKAPVKSQALVGQQSGKIGVPRQLPLGLSAARTASTSYFIYVDVYVDTDRPTNVTTLGNCPAQGGGTNWGWVYALGVGESIPVPIDCYLTSGPHTYYVQVDTCDNPPGACSPVYGYVQERNESNNIYPLLPGPLFLPVIQR